MSRDMCTAIGNLNYHVAELKRKMKSIHQARLDLIYYPNTPKAELITSFLIPNLESEVVQLKKEVTHWASELAKCEYNGNEDYENWYS